MTTRPNNPYGPAVAYSAATRRSIAKMEEQIALTEEYLGMLSHFPSESNRIKHLVDYARLVGIAICLSYIAENHRQWADYERWQTIQGRYARKVSDIEYNRPPAGLDAPTVGAL